MKKKRIFALFTGICLAFLIAGCKDNANSNTDSQGTNESSDFGSDTWSDENVDNNGWT